MTCSSTGLAATPSNGTSLGRVSQQTAIGRWGDNARWLVVGSTKWVVGGTRQVVGGTSQKVANIAYWLWGRWENHSVQSPHRLGWVASSGKELCRGAATECIQAIHPQNPLSLQLHQTVHKLLLAPAPSHLSALATLLQKASTPSTTLTQGESIEIQRHLQALVKDDCSSFKEFAPFAGWSEENLDLCRSLASLFPPRAQVPTGDEEEPSLPSQQNSADIQQFLVLLTDIMKRNPGGILNQAIEQMEHRIAPLLSQANSMVTSTSETIHVASGAIHAASRALTELSHTIAPIVTTCTGASAQQPTAPPASEAPHSSSVDPISSPERPEAGPPLEAFIAWGERIMAQLLNKGANVFSQNALSACASVFQHALSHALKKLDSVVYNGDIGLALQAIQRSLAPLAAHEGNWQDLLQQCKAVRKLLQQQGLRIYIEGIAIPFGIVSDYYELQQCIYSFLDAPRTEKTLNQIHNLLTTGSILQGGHTMRLSQADKGALTDLRELIEKIVADAPNRMLTDEEQTQVTPALRQIFPVLERSITYLDITHAGAPFTESLNILAKAADTHVTPPSANWKHLSEEEQGKLIKNTAHMLTLRYVYEKICGLQQPDDPQMYLTMLAQARVAAEEKTTTEEVELRKLFSQAILQKRVFIIKRIYAYILFFLVHKFANHYLDRAVRAYFNEIFTYIENHKGEEFYHLKNELTNNATRLLTVLGGAYDTIASSPTRTGTIHEMLATEMDKKESNRGYESQELYAKLAANALKKATRSSVTAWILGKLVFRHPERIVGSILNQATQSIEATQGYTHAWNVVLRKQLDHIWNVLLQHSLKQKAEPEPDRQLCSRPSDYQQQQLTDLLQNWLCVLRKSRCPTVDELRATVQDRTNIPNLVAHAEGMAIGGVINKAANLLATAVQMLITDDYLHEMTYTFSATVNQSFNPNAQISEEEMRKEEKMIAFRCSEILGLAIGAAVEDSLDLSGEKQHRETQKFAETIQEQLQTYVDHATKDLETLAQTNAKDPLSHDARKTMTERLFKNTEEYLQSSADTLLQIRASGIGPDNIHQLANHQQSIGCSLTPYCQNIADFKTTSKVLEKLDHFQHHLNELLAKVDKIQKNLVSTITIETLQEIKKTLGPPKKHGSIQTDLDTEVAALLSNIRPLDQVVQLRNECQTLRSQNSSLHVWKESRKKSHSQDRLALEQSRQQIRRLGEQEPGLSSQLHGHLLSMQQPNTDENLEEQHQAMLELLATSEKEAAQTIKQTCGLLQQQITSLKGSIQAILDKHPAQQKGAERAMQQFLQQAQDQLEQLTDLEKKESQAKIIPINFEVFDKTALLQMIKEVARSRITEKLNDVWRFLRQPNTVRCAVHHLALFPYLQSQQEM